MKKLNNVDNVRLIGELFRKDFFAKADEDILLRGIIAKEIVSNLVSKNKEEFTLHDVEFQIYDWKHASAINSILLNHIHMEHDFRGNTITIDEEYLANAYHNVFISGGILRKLEINRIWDGDFKVYKFKCKVDIEYVKDTVDLKSYIDFIEGLHSYNSHVDETYGRLVYQRSFGFNQDPWSHDNKLMTKMNYTAGIRELFKDLPIRKLEVEVVKHDIFVFYELYPTISNI